MTLYFVSVWINKHMFSLQSSVAPSAPRTLSWTWALRAVKTLMQLPSSGSGGTVGCWRWRRMMAKKVNLFCECMSYLFWWSSPKWALFSTVIMSRCLCAGKSWTSTWRTFITRSAVCWCQCHRWDIIGRWSETTPTSGARWPWCCSSPCSPSMDSSGWVCHYQHYCASALHRLCPLHTCWIVQYLVAVWQLDLNSV